MSLQKLFDIFDNYEKLWIDINDIRDQIVDFGIQDEINFNFVKIDEAIVRGFLHRYTRTNGVYGEPEFVSEIFIAVSLDENWQRVVAAKELLHILDTPKNTAQSEMAVDALLDNFSLPPEVRNPTNSYNNDRALLISAIAILVPKECRKIIRRLHADNKLDLKQISQFAKIPHRFSNMILGEEFDELISVINEF